MRVGIAADHDGFELKQRLIADLSEKGFTLIDFGDKNLQQTDDYPDYAFPLAEAVAKGEVERGIALCGSGVGVCIAANKVPGVRACLIHDAYSAHQGVEHDAVNILCMGAEVVGNEMALELVTIFLNARFTREERHRRRLEKIVAYEKRSLPHEQESAFQA